MKFGAAIEVRGGQKGIWYSVLTSTRRLEGGQPGSQRSLGREPRTQPTQEIVKMNHQSIMSVGSFRQMTQAELDEQDNEVLVLKGKGFNAAQISGRTGLRVEAVRRILKAKGKS